MSKWEPVRLLLYVYVFVCVCVCVCMCACVICFVCVLYMCMSACVCVCMCVVYVVCVYVCVYACMCICLCECVGWSFRCETLRVARLESQLAELPLSSVNVYTLCVLLHAVRKEPVWEVVTHGNTDTILSRYQHIHTCPHTFTHTTHIQST